jgi:hypothetical protein
MIDDRLTQLTQATGIAMELPSESAPAHDDFTDT